MGPPPYNIRITVLRPGLGERSCSVRALARWWEEPPKRRRRRLGIPPVRMRWREADAEGRPVARAAALEGTITRDDEGVRWARGWSGPDVDAMLAAAALMC